MMHTQKIPMKELAELILLQLETSGQATLTVTGYSMRPTLHERRDSVILNLPASRQKAGDIILYLRENGQYVLHRIIETAEEGYICSGDNQVMREPVSHSQVLAVVSGICRKGKRYPADSLGCRLYAAMCVGMFPVRKYYIALRRRLGRLRRKLFGKKHV